MKEDAGVEKLVTARRFDFKQTQESSRNKIPLICEWHHLKYCIHLNYSGVPKGDALIELLFLNPVALVYTYSCSYCNFIYYDVTQCHSEVQFLKYSSIPYLIREKIELNKNELKVMQNHLSRKNYSLFQCLLLLIKEINNVMGNNSTLCLTNKKNQYL